MQLYHELRRLNELEKIERFRSLFLKIVLLKKKKRTHFPWNESSKNSLKSNYRSNYLNTGFIDLKRKRILVDRITLL